jgi:hypothetical protein
MRAGIPNGALSHRPPKHQYQLLFYASESGLAKRVEISAQHVNSAIEFAISDRSQRTVDIWEDGDFLCRVSRDERSCSREVTTDARPE